MLRVQEILRMIAAAAFFEGALEPIRGSRAIAQAVFFPAKTGQHSKLDR